MSLPLVRFSGNRIYNESPASSNNAAACFTASDARTKIGTLVVEGNSWDTISPACLTSGGSTSATMQSAFIHSNFARNWGTASPRSYYCVMDTTPSLGAAILDGLYGDGNSNDKLMEGQ